MMIRSFKDKAAEAVFNGESPKGFAAPVKVTRRKLKMLNAATSLNDLRTPPRNQLVALSRERKGQHSIRINDPYRICFVWTGSGPEQVEVTDYHD